MNTVGFVSGIPSRGLIGTRARVLVSGRPAPSVRARSGVSGARMSLISGEAAKTAVGVYGAVVAGGGISAFLKTKSKPSLISGVIAGAILAYAYAQANVPLAMGTAAALAIVFGIRLAKTKKFMPSGLLLGLSVLFACVFAYSLYA